MGEMAVTVSGVLFTGIGLLLPALVTAAFVKPTAEILAMSIPAVRIYFLSFFAMGFNILYSTYFQSVMKPGYSLFICMMRGMVLNAVLVFLLPIAFGVTGIWSVMPVTEFLTLFVCRFLLTAQNKKLPSNGPAAV